MTQHVETPRLILASASPRRKALLSMVLSRFQVIDSGAEEAISRRHSPAAAVAILASRKALAVARRIPQGIVLAADTVIGFRGDVLGKPENDAHASEMLHLLRGQTHEVLTGMAVLNKCDGLKIVSVVSTKVRMRNYRDHEIRSYVQSGEPRDKAGAYAIQGSGGRLIEATHGCYNNVIGLPLCETLALLKSVGLPVDENSGICKLPSGTSCPEGYK